MAHRFRNSFVSDYHKQMQASLAAQRQNQARLQGLEQAKIRGNTDAKVQDATTGELMKSVTTATWSGLQVLIVVCFVILLFLFNSFFAKNKRGFWVLATLLMAMCVYRFTEVVRRDGALAISYLSA